MNKETIDKYIEYIHSEEYVKKREEYLKDLSYFYNQTEEDAEQHYKISDRNRN